MVDLWSKNPLPIEFTWDRSELSLLWSGPDRIICETMCADMMFVTTCVTGYITYELATEQVKRFRSISLVIVRQMPKLPIYTIYYLIFAVMLMGIRKGKLEARSSTHRNEPGSEWKLHDRHTFGFLSLGQHLRWSTTQYTLCIFAVSLSGLKPEISHTWCRRHILCLQDAILNDS